MENIIYVFGLLTTIVSLLTSISLLFQIRSIILAGNSDSTSLLAIVLCTVNVAFWLVYGLLINDLPLSFANFVALVLYLAWLIVAYHYRFKKGGIKNV